jgi:hypothetical protein
MTIRQPPRFAGRLLKRLVPAQNHDALLGDLSEEYQRRRSVTWYFLQILSAVVVGSWKDIRSHQLLAGRAAAVGLFVQFLVISATLEMRDVLTGAGFMWGTTWIGLGWYWHWPYASWSFAAFFQGAWIAGDVMIGWIIARLHRPHGVTMVSVFLAVMFVVRVDGLVRAAILSPWPQPVYMYNLSHALVDGFVISPLLMLFGGYLAARPSEVA